MVIPETEWPTDTVMIEMLLLVPLNMWYTWGKNVKSEFALDFFQIGGSHKTFNSLNE